MQLKQLSNHLQQELRILLLQVWFHIDTSLQIHIRLGRSIIKYWQNKYTIKVISI